MSVFFILKALSNMEIIREKLRLRIIKIMFICFLGIFCIISHVKHGVFSFQIPKKIHYVWLGSKTEPPMVQKAIESWKQYLPGYQIIRWDETNCPIEKNAYAKKMYAEKEYRFVADYCRFYALEKEGGVYFDTDMFIKKPLEPYLKEPLVLALEQRGVLSGGIFAARPHHPYIKEILKAYEAQNIPDKTMLPQFMSDVFKKVFPNYSLQRGFHKKREIILYNPNILMLDLNGGETAAEHYYANNSTTFNQRGSFYNHFVNIFLKEYGYRLNTINNPLLLICSLYMSEKIEHHATRYSVMLPNNKFYIVSLQNGRWLSVKNQTGEYHFFRNNLILSFSNGKTQVYQCHDRSCDPKTSYF